MWVQRQLIHHWSLLSNYPNYFLCLNSEASTNPTTWSEEKTEKAWVMLEFKSYLFRMMGETKVEEKELSQTLTWAIAGVSTFFVVVYVVLEKLILKAGTAWSWKLTCSWRKGLIFVLRFCVLCSVSFRVYCLVLDHLGTTGPAPQEISSSCLGEDQIRYLTRLSIYILCGKSLTSSLKQSCWFSDSSLCFWPSDQVFFWIFASRHILLKRWSHAI